MTDKEYTTGGDDPRPLHLTTCTGCGFALADGGVGTHCQNCGKPWAEADATSAVNVTTSLSMRTPPRIAPDECVVKRELLEEVLYALAWVADLDTFGIAVNYGTMPDGHRLHEAVDAALAAASGDDGGTP